VPDARPITRSAFAAAFVRAVRIHFEFPPHYLPAALSADLPGVLARLPRADALLFSLGAGLTPFATAAYVRLLSSTLCSPLGARLASLELRLSDAQCAQLGALGAWACRLASLALFVDDCGEAASALDTLAARVVLPARDTLTSLTVHFRVYGWQGARDSPAHEVRCGAFFAALEGVHFPLLTELRVATPFLDAKPRLEEAALLSIIRTHSLRTLDVTPTWLHLHIRPGREDVRAYAAGYARFLAALGSPGALPGTLQSLRLMVLLAAEEPLSLVTAVLQNIPHHLEELSLGGCALHHSQLRALLATGCTQRLRTLRVVPAVFGPDLLDTLAAAVPDLADLDLIVTGQTSPVSGHAQHWITTCTYAAPGRARSARVSGRALAAPHPPRTRCAGARGRTRRSSPRDPEPRARGGV
jgi:hypothetical protein